MCILKRSRVYRVRGIKMKGKLKSIIIMIALVVLAIIVVLNMGHEVTIMRYEEHTEIQSFPLWKLLFSLTIGVLIIFLIHKINEVKIHKNIKRVIMIFAMIGYIIFQVLWIKSCLLTGAGPDAEMVYGAAKRIFNNMDIGASQTYFAYYKQNIGLVMIFKNIMTIFQMDSLNLLRYCNIVANVTMILALYWIYKMIIPKENKKNNLLFSILILGFLLPQKSAEAY